jgi:hypothetical protein
LTRIPMAPRSFTTASMALAYKPRHNPLYKFGE